MPRPARPRWDPRRRRWLANIGRFDRQGRRREVYAPPSIGEKDEADAWGWFTAEKRRRGLDDHSDAPALPPAAHPGSPRP